jgi:hypothetical protein
MEFIFNKKVFYGIYLQQKRVLWNLPSTKTCFMEFIFNKNVFYGIYLQRKRVLFNLSLTKMSFVAFIFNEQSQSASLKLHAMSDTTPGKPASYLNLHT